ncbi:MAG: hypothetical protein VKO64_12330 [Candidatus Sericytochromatia bacterium]|nr:hypothetical protein [Candidatus Sericytochromatia bacterium]
MPAMSPLETLAAQLFREGYALAETVVSRPLQAALGTEAAGQMLSAVRDSYALGRQTGDEALEQTWVRMRLASHGELARVAGLVVQVDDRAAEIEDRLASLEDLVRAQHALIQAQGQRIEALLSLVERQGTATGRDVAPVSRTPRKPGA